MASVNVRFKVKLLSPPLLCTRIVTISLVMRFILELYPCSLNFFNSPSWPAILFQNSKPLFEVRKCIYNANDTKICPWHSFRERRFDEHV